MSRDFTRSSRMINRAIISGLISSGANVTDLSVMPGTGEGKPPPLMGILREHGFAPLVLLTAAAMVTDTIVNGIGILGPEIKRSFHLSDTGLGAVIFVGAVAQIAWGMPVAVLVQEMLYRGLVYRFIKI